MTDTLLWALRAAWLVLPLTMAPALGDAIDARSASVGLVIEALAWVLWAAGLVAVLVPRTVGLTAARILGPGAVLLAVWGVASDGVEAVDLVGLVATAAVSTVLFTPQIGAAFVDGSSYGPERRIPLAPPAALLFGPVQLAVVAVLAGIAAGPLLLAARQWVLGGVLLAVGPVVAALAARSLHGLSRRWLVLVPGGIVVHDPLTLTDPTLLPKEALMSIAPAETGTQATDLTQRARGLAVEIRLAEPGQFTLARAGHAEGEIVRSDTVLVTPSLPADLLAAANPHSP